MSRDLKSAKVYVTSNESSESFKATLSHLNRARPYIRRQLGAGLTTKFTPAISFLKDEVPERSGRVISLIEKASVDGRP